MEQLIEKLVATAVSKVPADIRVREADILRASMTKALTVLTNYNAKETAWTERVLRRMAEQYTTFQGQGNPQKGKR